MTSPSGYTVDSLDMGGYGSLVDAVLEYVPDLMHPQSVVTYGKMRRDPQLAAVLRAYVRPITRAAIFLDGEGCRDEVVKQVADDIGLPIKGADEKPKGARRRGVVYRDHLRLSLLDLPFGFMAFEQQQEPVAGRMRLTKLAERMPQTIASVKTDSDGGLLWAEQNAVARDVPRMTPPTLVWYANEREGANWFGQSLLRESFSSWLIKDQMLRVHATSIRRFGMGIPTAQALPGTNPTPAEIGAAQRVVGQYRASEHAGIAMPPGFRLALEGMTGNVPDALAFITYLDRMMTRSTLTSILDMAAAERGNRSLGETVMDLLIMSQQSIADAHAADFTRQVIVPLVDANWGEGEPAPQVSFSDVGADYELTAQDANHLLQYGGLTHDDQLEGWFRARYGAPPIDLATRAQIRVAPETQPDVIDAQPAPVAAPKPVAAAAGSVPQTVTLRRDLTPIEAAAGTDFTGHQHDWQDALDVLVASWASITRAQRQQLVDQVKAAFTSGRIDQLADLSVDTASGAAKLAAAMIGVAKTAADKQVLEAAAQGVQIAPGVADAAAIRARAELVTSLLGDGLSSAAARRAAQLWTPGATSDGLGGSVMTYLAGLGDGGLRARLGGALTSAQNDGRLATVDLSILAGNGPDLFVASEVLDQTTCDPCAAVDGTTFDSFDDMQLAYGSGGYADCLGGDQCRGTGLSLWNADQLAPAA